VKVVEGPNISKKSDGCERDIIKEELQQATTGEQAENEVSRENIFLFQYHVSTFQHN